MSDNVERTSLWIAVVTLALAIITSVVLVSMNAGQAQARISTLEDGAKQTVHNAEWQQFETEMRSRLDRIERKIDAQGGPDAQ